MPREREDVAPVRLAGEEGGLELGCVVRCEGGGEGGEGGGDEGGRVDFCGWGEGGGGRGEGPVDVFGEAGLGRVLFLLGSYWALGVSGGLAGDGFCIGTYRNPWFVLWSRMMIMFRNLCSSNDRSGLPE